MITPTTIRERIQGGGVWKARLKSIALFTESAVIFIEAKRTELAPSKGIRFALTRDQIARNLDCARRYGKDKSVDFYAMLIIEDGDKQRAFKELVFPMPDGQPICSDRL